MPASKKQLQQYTSTSLENDLANVSLFDGIIVTKPLSDTIRKVSTGANDLDQKNSAISIIGPFGSGKSTSAFVAYHYLRDTIPNDLKDQLAEHDIAPIKNRFQKNEIIVLTGRKMSLNGHISEVLKEKNDIVDGIRQRLGSGKKLALIIDEFGKYLEFNSDNPEHGDVYLLQELAELAQRSNGSFLLLTIRHQALSAYLSSVKSKYINEWKKIQGRFSDIVHTTNLNETLKMFHLFFDKRFPNRKSDVIPAEINDVFKGNNMFSEDIAIPILRSCYPLHPITTLIMISSFKRFGQNDRSIFTFIGSNERNSLNEWIRKSNGTESYSLWNFYDFIQTNMRFNLTESEINSDWRMVESAIDTYLINSDNNDQVEHESILRLLKSIGLIQIFGKDVGLQSNKDILHASLVTNPSAKEEHQVEDALDLVRKKNIVTFKNLYKTYVIWEGSDLDVNALIEHTIEGFSEQLSLSPYLNKYFHIAPIIAQKHYVEKGTMRWATFEFCDIDHIFNSSDDAVDALIRCLIINNNDDKKKLQKELNKYDDTKSKKVIPLLLVLNTKAREDFLTFIAINELLLSNDEIKKDKIARKEMRSRLSDYKKKLDTIFLNRDEYETELFIWDNNQFNKISWNGINSSLTNKVEEIYPYTPVIHNELINNSKPSPSANIGVMKFLQALHDHPYQMGLSIEGTGPEKSIYLNLLERTGLHREVDGHYQLTSPSNEENLDYLWKKWDEIITSSKTGKINLTDLQKVAKEPPFGLKEGLAKILSIVKLFEKLNQVSIYERNNIHGTESFIEEIYTDDIELMYKRPEMYDLKYVKTEKIHKSLFIELYRILDVDKGQKEQASLTSTITMLGVVKPLIKFINGLKGYTKQTLTISEPYHDVIQKIINSVSPEDLIYIEIPKALGLKSISEDTNEKDLQKYIKKLEEWHRVVHRFNENIINRINNEFQVHWDIKPRNEKVSTTYKYLRDQINEDVASFFIDFQLKEFAKRVLETNNDHDEWLESVVSAMAGARLENWNDDDHALFIERLNNFHIRVKEAEELNRKHQIRNKYKKRGTKSLTNSIRKFLDSLDNTNEKKIAALLQIQEELEKKIKN